jgi:hypothetical protein
MSAIRNDDEHAPAAAHVDANPSDGEAAAPPGMKEGATAVVEPPLPDEEAPPLPNEPPPDQDDDGWTATMDPVAQTWLFYNKRTGVSQWENPRVPAATAYSQGPYDRFANFYHFFCPFPA